MTDQEKLNSILRHIKKVEDNCNLLARKMYEENPGFAIMLIQRGRIHDVSKFNPYEFAHLHDVNSRFFSSALNVHHSKNSHHPEYWDLCNITHKRIFFDDPSNDPKTYKEEPAGIHCMKPIDVAEMVCDCLARSQEFGTDIRKWFFGNTEQDAPFKYKYTNKDEVWHLIEKYLNLLLTPTFNK